MERVQAAAAGSLSETEQTLGEQVLCSRQMEEAIDLWRRVYENDAPWLEGGRVKGMNLLPAICSEVARLVTLEFDWTVEGSGRAAFLNRQIQPVRQRLGSVWNMPWEREEWYGNLISQTGKFWWKWYRLTRFFRWRQARTARLPARYF